MKKKSAEKKTIKSALSVLLVFVITFLLIYTNVFYSWDKMVSDWLCQTGRVPDSRIYILAIDDKTLEQYGPMNQWSRDIYTNTVEILNQDADRAPAVICFDIMYLEDTDTKVDTAFADACAKGGNVVTAMNLQFKEMPEIDENGNLTINQFYIEQASYPIDTLKNAASYGYANTLVDEDGYVRRTMAQVDYEEEVIYSLATEVYRSYMIKNGQEPVLPVLDENNQFSFQYAVKSGGYSVISLCDLLDGTVSSSIFQNGIVFVGAYASGLYDSYVPAISHGEQMYGVEVQANIVDALLNGATQQEIPKNVYALLAALLASVYYLLAKKLKTIPSAIVMFVMATASVLFAKVAYQAGYILPVLVFPAMLVLLYVVTMVRGYMEETRRKRQILNVFRKYVAPQIVEEIGKKGEFEVKLGGEKRHIAVLFVDIRGFTTMSESLQPEEVVEILNEYLSLTTQSIFKNSGTLDKFVGDATMAVFNAPFALEDYVYKAVKTAWDMKAGAEDLAKKFEERFEKSVAFGIGVNCGEAVVGNIGCEFRMDYTAIGDTVNTAARLESNAKRGQILISSAVYEQVKDRVEVTPIGEIPLKGKAKGVFVYQVDEVR
ncbi:MAG: CHASE2 domain-containing protein [Roseburia sp.]